jgi:hypothetical protein
MLMLSRDVAQLCVVLLPRSASYAHRARQQDGSEYLEFPELSPI